MIAGRAASPGDQRYAGLPWPIADELARPQLVARLAGRWRAPLTLVVAGAGFGKSTTLAQAVRADALAPSGIEGWVGIEPGLEHADALAAAVLSALGASPSTANPLAEVVTALRAISPLDVCLIVDDVHQLPASSSSTRLLGALLRALPRNAHLVLAGRTLDALPLGRLRAGGTVLEITEQDLSFSPAESARLSGDRGGRSVPHERFGGWPALHRLARAGPGVAAADYLREEVLSGLSSDERRALFALAAIGWADEPLVEQICCVPVDLARLERQVPLVGRVGDIGYRAHELWLGALDQDLDPEVGRDLRSRAVAALAERGELTRAGSLATRHRDWAALQRISLDLVRTTMMALPVETAAGWLLSVPAEVANTAELRLLAAAVRCVRDYTTTSADALIDRSVAEFCAAGEHRAEVVAISLGILIAQARHDTERVRDLSGRAAVLEESALRGDDTAIGRFARFSTAAALAELHGEPEAALEQLERADLRGLPLPVTRSAQRLLMRCLLLAGRADEAAEIAGTALQSAGNHHLRHVPAFARWLGGDPEGFESAEQLDAYELGMASASSRDAFIGGMVYSAVAAAWGRSTAFAQDQIRVAVATPTVPGANPRDAAFLVNARAAAAIADHDEGSAAQLLAQFRIEHPPSDRPAERHLRRFLALGYVLDPVLRDWWDAAVLGPCHHQARAVARRLVDARNGSRAAATAGAMAPGVVFTVLPLPWSMELACRLRALGSPDGLMLVEWIVERVGAPARAELRRIAESGSTLAGPARAFLSQVPVEPTTTTRITVMGPLDVQVDGSRADGSRRDRVALRRVRVRELLAMLVLEHQAPRDLLVDTLWPDLDPESGAANLRVTLAHLRKVLEPERGPGEAGFHLHADATTVRLVRSPKLTADLWEWRALCAEADRVRGDGDIDGWLRRCRAAIELWQDVPLADLAVLPRFETALAELASQHLKMLLATGEVLLTQGAVDDALSAAERVLAMDPYRERGHRLAIAAQLNSDDPGRAGRAARRTLSMLDELGVDPEPSTGILIRRAMSVPAAGSASAAG